MSSYVLTILTNAMDGVSKRLAIMSSSRQGKDTAESLDARIQRKADKAFRLFDLLLNSRQTENAAKLTVSKITCQPDSHFNVFHSLTGSTAIKQETG